LRQQWNLRLISELSSQAYVLLLRSPLDNPRKLTLNLYDLMPPPSDALSARAIHFAPTRLRISTYSTPSCRCFIRLVSFLQAMACNCIAFKMLLISLTRWPQLRRTRGWLLSCVTLDCMLSLTPISWTGKPLPYIYEEFKRSAYEGFSEN